MEGQEMEEYEHMTLEEEAIISQLMPRERAEHQEMAEFYQTGMHHRPGIGPTISTNTRKSPATSTRATS